MTIAQFLDAYHGISDGACALLRGALSTRGKNKGNILASAPADARRRGAWRACMSTVCVQRAGLIALAWASTEERDAFALADALIERVGLGVIINTLERPFRFNLWALHHDVDAARAKLAEFLADDTRNTGAK